nr:ankyrin repeat domain-containing protein [Endozoicomonas sp.]
MHELTSTSSARPAYYREPSTDDSGSPENQNFNEKYLEESPFLKACRGNNAGEVQKLLKDNPELAGIKFTSTTEGGYYYPLHVAAQEGHVNIITELCANNINVNDIMADGSTALHIASLYGHVEAVKELIKRAATTDHVRHDNASPLSLALAASHFDVSEVLLEAGANKNPGIPILDLKNKNPCPLILYLQKAKNWQTFFVRENKQGLTALDFASHQGHVKTVDFLLTHGADVNHEDHEGNTALHQAADCGHAGARVIRAIMLHNPADASPDVIDVSKKNKDENTPLKLAYLKNNHDAVEALKEYGADPNVELTDIKTNPLLDSADWKNSSKPLHIAAQNGHLEKVRKIIKRDGSIDKKENSGSTALSYAFRYGHFHVTELLLKAGATKPTRPNYLAHLLNKSDSEWKASFNEKNDQGLTTLGVASLHNLHRTGEMLIQFGAEPNALMEDGYTPLHIASINGSHATAKVLITAGARVDFQHQPDKATALSLAFAKRNYAMTELFLNKDADNKLDRFSQYIDWDWEAHFNQKNDHDRIDLLDISARGYARTVEVMLNYGIDVNATDKNGCTALHFASRYGQDKVISAILEHDSVKEAEIINKLDGQGFTPLMTGIRYARPDVVKVLINYEADTRQKYTYQQGKKTISISLLKLAEQPKASLESELAALNKHKIVSQRAQTIQGQIKNYQSVIDILSDADCIQERDNPDDPLI